MAATSTISLSHDQLLAALERRFDFLSARAVAAELLAVAGVVRADHYDAAAAGRLRAAAETSLSRAGAVLEALAVSAPARTAAEVAPPPVAAVAEMPSAPAAATEGAAESSAAAESAAAPAEKADKKKKA